LHSPGGSIGVAGSGGVREAFGTHSVEGIVVVGDRVSIEVSGGGDVARSDATVPVESIFAKPAKYSSTIPRVEKISALGSVSKDAPAYLKVHPKLVTIVLQPIYGTRDIVR